MLSLFGVPKLLRTDNASYFRSEVFEEFMKNLGITHRKITPLHPQANAEVERLMRTIQKNLKCSEIEKSDWKSNLEIFLMNYRSTPHSTTKISPYEALFNRKMNTKLPSASSAPSDKNIAVEDKLRKSKMKKNADKDKG